MLEIWFKKTQLVRIKCTPWAKNRAQFQINHVSGPRFHYPVKTISQRQSKCYWERKLLIRIFFFFQHVCDYIIYTHCFSWYTRIGGHEFMAPCKCHNLNRKLSNHLDPYQNKIPQAIKLWIKVLHFIILINYHINFKANVTRYCFWI